VATSESYNANVWKGILSEARAVAMPAMLTADPSTATVTITGSRTDVDRFARWVRNISRRLQRQVQVNIHVYTVTLNNDSNYGLAPSVIWKYLKGLNSVSITAPSALELASGATPSTIQFSAGHGPFSGTQAAVNALSQVGSVRQVYSNSLLALNGHVVTVNDATNYGYLAESSGDSAIAGANTYGSQTLMPGNISAGAAIRVLPRVADDNRIVLSIVFRFIGTPTFKTITSGTESIQIPQDPETAFNQTLDMRSGATVMLLGFKNQQDSKTLEGTGSPKFWLFGGGRMHERQRSITVVTVTATAS
jgi:type IVB pilus formation R64 PilN family outer membrane protein